MTLSRRSWISSFCEELVQTLSRKTSAMQSDDIAVRIVDLITEKKQIHESERFNLNPTTNVMNARAEALLASGLGSRPSLGYPGDKYRMGFEAIEEIEVIAAELCAEVFNVTYAEICLLSGVISVFMASWRPAKQGDTIVLPPASVGGHVTHHMRGYAGLY